MNAAAARELATELQGYLAGIDCEVTLDPITAGGVLAAGSAVVIVGPPRVEYPTYNTADAAWEVLAATGPIGDRLEAWEALDDVLEPLLEPLSVTSAEPATYTPAGTSEEFSALLIRFTTTYTF